MNKSTSTVSGTSVTSPVVIALLHAIVLKVLERQIQERLEARTYEKEIPCTCNAVTCPRYHGLPKTNGSVNQFHFGGNPAGTIPDDARPYSYEPIFSGSQPAYNPTSLLRRIHRARFAKRSKEWKTAEDLHAYHPVNSDQPTFSRFLGKWQASPAWGLPVHGKQANINNGEKAWPPHRGKIPSPSTTGGLNRRGLGYLRLLARRHATNVPINSVNDVVDLSKGRALRTIATERRTSIRKADSLAQYAGSLSLGNDNLLRPRPDSQSEWQWEPPNRTPDTAAYVGDRTCPKSISKSHEAAVFVYPDGSRRVECLYESCLYLAVWKLSPRLETIGFDDIEYSEELEKHWESKLHKCGLGKINLPKTGSLQLPVSNFFDDDDGDGSDIFRIDSKSETKSTENVPPPRKKYAEISIKINVRNEKRTPEFEQWLRKHPNFNYAVAAHQSLYCGKFQAEEAERLGLDESRLSLYMKRGYMGFNPVVLDARTAEAIAGKYFAFVAVNNRFDLHTFGAATDIWEHAVQAYLRRRQEKIASAVRRAKNRFKNRNASAKSIERYLRSVREPLQYAWNANFVVRMRDGVWPEIREIIVGPRGDLKQWCPPTPAMYDALRLWLSPSKSGQRHITH